MRATRPRPRPPPPPPHHRHHRRRHHRHHHRRRHHHHHHRQRRHAQKQQQHTDTGVNPMTRGKRPSSGSPQTTAPAPAPTPTPALPPAKLGGAGADKASSHAPPRPPPAPRTQSLPHLVLCQLVTAGIARGPVSSARSGSVSGPSLPQRPLGNGRRLFGGRHQPTQRRRGRQRRRQRRRRQRRRQQRWHPAAGVAEVAAPPSAAVAR